MRLHYVAALAILVPSISYADSLTYDTTIFNTNFVTGAVGMRDTGSGNLVIGGVPAGATVTRTNLYWHGPTNSSNLSSNASVTVAGQAVTGTNIGFAHDNFWGYANSQSYQANVTSAINGNGTYALSNFTKPDSNVNGAAAFVFYDGGSSAGKEDVILYHGNDSNFASPTDPAGWDFTAGNIDYNGGEASLTLYVSDGQNFSSFDDGTLTINGQALASGGIFQGVAPGQNVGNGTLTDIVVYDLTPYLVPGINSLNIRLDAGFNDALSLVAAAFAVPAGAAPPTQAPVPEPGTLSLVGLALVAAGACRARFARSMAS
ncbi:MAG TPA: PEP-CTERM sorting domain-containing protein [Granulicella sp.]